MKDTVGRLGYVAAVRAACLGSRGHDMGQLTLARPKPTRSAFNGTWSEAAVDVIPICNLPTWVLSLVSLVLACALEYGKVVAPGIVSGAQVSARSSLGVPPR